MEPRIRYAETKDGVGIAFYTIGEGDALVEMPILPWSHIQLALQMPEWQRYYERLSEKRMIVRYDGRGTGLSERGSSDWSIDSLVLDLDAVVDSLGLERFALMAILSTGPVAIAYAARHPERVSHLLLWCTYAAGKDYSELPQVKAFSSLREQDWEIYTQAGAHAFLGWEAADHARWYAKYMQESTTQNAAFAAYQANERYDSRPLLSQLQMPTLVLHRRQFLFPGPDIARGLASKIPDARLALLEGTSAAPFLADTEAVIRAMDEFLGYGEESAEAPEVGAFRSVLFTDVEGSTALPSASATSKRGTFCGSTSGSCAMP